MQTGQIPLKIVESFGFNHLMVDISNFSNGLINSTFKVTENGKTHVLQKINSTVFSNPIDLIENYIQLFDYLETKKLLHIPTPIKTVDHNYFAINSEKEIWRAFEFFPNTITVSTVQNKEQAFGVAHCFGNLTNTLALFPVHTLKVTLPNFHNLSFRFEQFQTAIKQSSSQLKENSNVEINTLLNKSALVQFYEKLKTNSSYKLRVMHHDAKLSNVLFEETTNKIICPIDFDTMQSGYYFSDLGDMVRSMTCTISENSEDVDLLEFREDIYEALISGYLSSLKSELTEVEKSTIHYSGLLMIYMQALRFLTDYLNRNVYYQINYPDQNLTRAKNQIAFLSKLEYYLKTNNLINSN